MKAKDIRITFEGEPLTIEKFAAKMLRQDDQTMVEYMIGISYYQGRMDKEKETYDQAERLAALVEHHNELDDIFYKNYD